MKKENTIHVKINEPTELRRNILEAAIESAESLKIYEKTKAIRRNKKTQEKELKAIMKELKLAIDLLDKNLPWAGTEEIKPKPKILKPKKIEEPRQIIKPEPKSRLEMDLEEIKRKLSRL